MVLGEPLVISDSFEASNLTHIQYEWDFTIFNHGREALQFVGLSKDEAEKGKDTIDVDQAECFHIDDKRMILDEIVKKHGSTAVFNEKLKNKWTDVCVGIN